MRSYHHRQVQIAEVLVRYGMGYLMELLGLDGLVSFERRLLKRDPARTRPEDLRLALEELGSTFVKLGQVLSTRADLLPPEYQVELSKLQDYAPAVPSDVIQEIVSRELQSGTDKAFAKFDLVPLACASIGQAHTATLHDGTEVVVKVRRPSVVEEVEQDLEILQNLAARASRRWEDAARWDLKGVAEQFGRILLSELDYLQEARNAERFAANFSHDHDVRVPRVFHELTTSRVITLERMTGMKISDVAALDEAGVDRRALAERATRIFAKSVFQDGFFHGDPHPGNFFIEPSGRVGIIDFGRVGVIDDRLRSQLMRLLIALARNNPERMVRALLSLGAATGPVDRTSLQNDLSDLLSLYTGQSGHNGAVRAVLGEVLKLVRRYNLTIPHDLALLFTVIMIDEGIAATLDPEFRFEEVLAPFAERQVAHELSPAAVARRIEQFGIDAAELAVDLPAQLHRLLEMLGEGRGFEINLRAAELESLVSRFEHLGNRIAASILAAAVIDGMSGLGLPNRRELGWRKPAIAAGLAVVSSLGAYEAWRRSPAAAALDRLRSSSPRRSDSGSPVPDPAWTANEKIARHGPTGTIDDGAL
jgi:ubiquinone biosynthesis protein